MKWEEEGYTRKDEHGNIISIVRDPPPHILPVMSFSRVAV